MRSHQEGSERNDRTRGVFVVGNSARRPCRGDLGPVGRGERQANRRGRGRTDRGRGAGRLGPDPGGDHERCLGSVPNRASDGRSAAGLHVSGSDLGLQAGIGPGNCRFATRRSARPGASAGNGSPGASSAHAPRCRREAGRRRQGGRAARRDRADRLPGRDRPGRLAEPPDSLHRRPRCSRPAGPDSPDRFAKRPDRSSWRRFAGRDAPV